MPGLGQKREGLYHFMNNSLKDWINCLILLTANVGFLSVRSNPIPCCEYKAHEKIPLMELQFMLSQRSKLGERGTMQIAYVDIPDSVRHATKPERR